MDDVTFEPKGFRDIYWCDLSNEPFIIEYRHNQKEPLVHCSNCGWDDSLDENGPSEVWLEHHKFICHIHKPRYGRILPK